MPEAQSDVLLRPMAEQEFRTYREQAVHDYAAEVQRNAGVDPDAALRNAERAFAGIVPDGLSTPGHRLFIAEDPSGEPIGLLWLAKLTREGVETAWIYDVRVEEPLRGRGYGRRLMILAEEQARQLGARRLELNVFGDNERARRLYASLGYVEMSRQLYKELRES